MTHALCTLSAVPIRREPADASEMTNQMLFGEVAEILEKEKKWSRIKLLHDNYEGWIDIKQLTNCEEDFYENYIKKNHLLSQELIQIASSEKSQVFLPIFLGSVLPFYDKNHFKINGVEWHFEGEVSTGKSTRNDLVSTAMKYQNAPYLWGGRSPFGIDCSGLVQMVFRLGGHDLPRDAYQQAEIGETLSFLEETQPADLAFFDNEEGRITHVGILLNPEKIIHASGRVRVDNIDQTGIFNAETQSYSHKLRVIKRII